MKRFFTFVLILGFIVCSVGAQHVLREEHFSWNQRRPIIYSPITEKELIQKYRGPTITEILTLPNGKKIRFKDYIAEINKVEKWLNQKGFSLRTPGDNTGLVFRYGIDRDKLEIQKRSFEPNRISMGLPDFNVIDLTKMDEIIWFVRFMEKLLPHIKIPGSFTPGGGGSGSSGGEVESTGTTPIPYIEPLISRDYPYGSENTIHAHYSSSLSNIYMREYDENPTLRHLQSNIVIKSSAAITMFGHRFDIFSSSLNPTYQNGPGGIASVSGINGLLDASTPLQGSSSGSPSHGVTGYSASTLITVGFIPVRLTLSLGGEIGWNWNTTSGESGASAISSPYFDIWCTGSAGVDAVIAEAGVRCDLTVLAIDEAIESRLSNSGTDAIDRMSAATININMLSGKIELYVQVYYPTWRGFRKKTWRIEVVDWEGMTFTEDVLPREEVTKPAYQ